MCRLAAYLGPPILLENFLVQPPHSLIKQSWAPKEMNEAALNADGFGIGWYQNESRPCTYLNTQPIWADVNLEHLSVSLSSPLWLANVRSATPGQMTGLANTQPFVSDNMLYMHNGFIEGFNPEIRQRFHEVLSPEIQAGITGNTDSEYLFALFRENMKDSKQDFVNLFKSTIASFSKIIKDSSALLNIIISDGSDIYALRHSINNACPSLYFTHKDDLYTDAALIASEKLTENDSWQNVPEHSLIILNKDQEPEVISL
jgi:glutamine amidotransferase